MDRRLGLLLAVACGCGSRTWEDEGFCFQDRAFEDPERDYAEFVLAGAEVLCSYDWYCTAGNLDPPGPDWWGSCLDSRGSVLWLAHETQCFDGCLGGEALRKWNRVNLPDCTPLGVGVDYPIYRCEE